MKKIELKSNCKFQFLPIFKEYFNMEKAQEALDDFDYAKYGEEPKDYYAELKDMDWSKYDQARNFVLVILKSNLAFKLFKRLPHSLKHATSGDEARRGKRRNISVTIGRYCDYFDLVPR